MKKGFTLLEILIVVIIIAVLVLVAAPQYTFSVEKGKASVMISQVRRVNDAVDLYNVRRGEDSSLPVLTKFSQLDLGDITDDSNISNTELGTITLDLDANNVLLNVIYARVGGAAYSIRIPQTGDYAGKMQCVALHTDSAATKICEAVSRGSIDAEGSGSASTIIYNI